MSTSPAPNLTLTAKQQSVLPVLWPCLKSPPHIDVQIGPAGIRLGATFEKTALGMVCETVRSEHNQIAVAATLDVAAVEVDFVKLKAAAGLASVEEAAEIWESIKDLVESAAAATPVSRIDGTTSASTQISWIWLTENTGHSRDVIDDIVWKGRQFKAMIALFEGGLLCFMDIHLETELAKIKCGSGIFVSVMKSIDILLGQELRTLCEAAQQASKSRAGLATALDGVPAEHSHVFATSLDGQTMSKIDTMLAGIEHGRTILSMELSAHDELYAATCI